MYTKTGITITSALGVSEIRNTVDFPYSCVIDLRRCVNNGPFPIEEATLRRLNNFRVVYEQLPVSLYSASSRKENDLFRMIVDHHCNVLVLTDEEAAMYRFCETLDIPVAGPDTEQLRRIGVAAKVYHLAS